MSQYGDPGFQYHQLLGQVWALLILEMADRPILPFDLEAYAHTVQNYVKDLDMYAGSEEVPQELREAHSAFDLMPLYRAADEFLSNAQEFHQWDRDWSSSVMATGFEGNVSQTVRLTRCHVNSHQVMAIKRMSHNTRMANFETNLLDVDGGVSEDAGFPCYHGVNRLMQQFARSRIEHNSNMSFSHLKGGAVTTRRTFPPSVMQLKTAIGGERRRKCARLQASYLMRAGS